MLGFAIVIGALVTGCGERQEDDGRLTAADLAELTDVHAWKVSLPKSQPPIRAIRLVISNRRDRTSFTKFSTGDNLGTNCTSFLLGIHVDQGRFKGHLFARNADGSGAGWDLDFTDPITGTPEETGFLVQTRSASPVPTGTLVLAAGAVALVSFAVGWFVRKRS